MSYETARAFADQLMEQLAPRPLAPGSTCLWIHWCERFVEIYLPNRRKRSQRTIRSVIRAHVRPSFARLHIHEIRIARVQSWIASMRSRGAAPATIANRYRVLRRMLRCAKIEGFAVEVPAAGDVDLPRSDKPRGSTRPLHTDELRRILATAQEPWRTLFALLAFCGLRINEALGLRWCDIDLESRRLLIRRQAGGGGDVAPKTTSSYANRVLPPRLLEQLRTLQTTRRGDDQGLVFPSPRGGAYDDTGVRRHHLDPLLARLGIDDVSFHSFRRWFGTQGDRIGASIPTLQRLLRHSSWRSTQRYVHVDTDEVDRAIEAIEKSVNPLDEPELMPKRNDLDEANSA